MTTFQYERLSAIEVGTRLDSEKRPCVRLLVRIENAEAETWILLTADRARAVAIELLQAAADVESGAALVDALVTDVEL